MHITPQQWKEVAQDLPPEGMVVEGKFDEDESVKKVFYVFSKWYLEGPGVPARNKPTHWREIEERLNDI